MKLFAIIEATHVYPTSPTTGVYTQTAIDTSGVQSTHLANITKFKAIVDPAHSLCHFVENYVHGKGSLDALVVLCGTPLLKDGVETFTDRLRSTALEVAHIQQLLPKTNVWCMFTSTEHWSDMYKVVKSPQSNFALHNLKDGGLVHAYQLSSHVTTYSSPMLFLAKILS